MANAKFVKTAAAVALGTSVVATAVAPSASAATTYKIKSGKLVNAKTGKVVKGFKTFKKVLYKNGKKYTGTRSGKYYKKGVLSTGTYKGVKYQKGLKFTGISKADGKFYKNGVVGTGTYKGVKYKKGVEFTGVSTNGKYYEDGVLFTGVKEDKKYVDGVLFTGTEDGKKYVDGALLNGKDVDGVVFVDGVKDEVAPEITAEDKTVEYGSAAVDVDALATVKDNSGEELKATATITFDGKEVKSIDTKTPGKYTVAYAAKDANGNEGKKEITVTVAEPAVPEVETVETVNPTEVLVKTNSKLNKESAETASNYTVLVNGATVAATSAKLQEDGRSVLVRFANPVENNQTIKVSTKDSLLTTEYKKVAKFESSILVFSDKTAPTVKSVEFNGSDVVATFSEEVQSVTNIRINGNTVTLGAAVKNEAGNYEYKLTNAPTQAGEYNVVFSQITDKANNETGTATASYKVVADASAPTVKSVEAVNSNTFTINFSKAVDGDDLATAVKNLKVQKGSSVIATDRVNGTLSADKKSATITVDESENGELKLYNDNETSVELTVSFDGYKDANGLLGSAYTGKVTLSKDAKAPAILSKNLVTLDADKKVITVAFDEAITAVTAKENDIVVKKDGIVQTTLKPTVAVVADTQNKNTKLELTFATALTDGEYDVVLPKGLVKDTDNNENASDTVSVKVSSVAATFIPKVTANKNVITVESDKDLTDSAKDVANYTLDDAALPAGTTIDFIDDKKHVNIVLPASFQVPADANYKLGVSANVKNIDGASASASATEAKAFFQQVPLTDNVAPVLKSAKLVTVTGDDTKFDKIELTLSESAELLDTVVDEKQDFVVTVNGSKVVVTNVAVANDKVTLTLDASYNVLQTTTVEVAPISKTNTVVDVVDTKGNALTTGTTVTATK
ncbi:immunoglobulin-like domain-containing protein [Kurthia massiliensis]|uniref:immunoglobulin-like domain-containing protein n=1 Tax=Kurthia massiliensis TaxID=1033739 RepID=UPI0002883653|nr:immunoglobulin-like domain-containing protein [Kurthia massiliensis]